jgi:predicted site-specific integrase-resolvase
MGVKITSVKINFYRFATQKNYAKMKGVSKQVVNNWFNRGKIEMIRVEGLDLNLVKIPRNEWELRKEWVDRGGL